MANFFFYHYVDGTLEYSQQFNDTLKKFLNKIESEDKQISSVFLRQEPFFEISKWFLLNDESLFNFFVRQKLPTVQCGSSYWVCIIPDSYEYSIQNDLFKKLENFEVCVQNKDLVRELDKLLYRPSDKEKVLKAMNRILDKEVQENFESILNDRTPYHDIRSRIMKVDKNINDWDREWHPLREAEE